MVTAPMYAQWCERKLWTVQESICLVLGIEPETPWLRESHAVGGLNPLSEAIGQYAELASDAMKWRVLRPFDESDMHRPPEERRVVPRQFLEWARSRNIVIPEELAPVLSREPVPAPPSDPAVFMHLGRGYRHHGDSGSGAAREQVLGAALAALRSYPERCRDAAGIRRVIEENAPLIWADSRVPPLPGEEIEALVGRWLICMG